MDGWTGFSDCFTHARSGRPAEDRAALLTAILADGINLGLARMAESCRGPSLRQLAWTHDWHVREECYAAARKRQEAGLTRRAWTGRRPPGSPPR